ncbi:hypothetical protein K438DRAFT_1857681 [Mycena galopus ATCC 62051]|nr:hypothetical protein K438DRAFT_1857681 [Mycena galopus ATCC 62051]
MVITLVVKASDGGASVRCGILQLSSTGTFAIVLDCPNHGYKMECQGALKQFLKKALVLVDSKATAIGHRKSGGGLCQLRSGYDYLDGTQLFIFR